MLPSTGYFKALNCPFYDNGLCERPYCHYRHHKKENQNICNDGIFEQLVSEAVKKALQQSDGAMTQRATEDSIKGNSQGTNSRATYNPTPISELKRIIEDTDIIEKSIEQKRRHIPVPYTPFKPTTMPTKRPTTDNNGSIKPFVYMPPKYTPGSTDNPSVDPYLPKGSSESTGKYLPGSEKGSELPEYTPATDSIGSSKISYVPSDKSDAKPNKKGSELPEYSPAAECTVSSKLSYIPSDKLDGKSSKKRLLEYRPTIVTNKADIPRHTYQPTPLAQVPCFSSDEDEPDQKKKKISTNINNLDGLEDEFDILDQILDEEKSNDTNSYPTKTNGDKEEKKSSNDKKHDNKHKKTSVSENKKSDRKERKKSEEQRSRSNDKKSLHKSSHKDKYRDKDKSVDKKFSEKSSSKVSSSKGSESDASKKSSHSPKKSRHSLSSKSSDSRSSKKDDKKKVVSSKDRNHSTDRRSSKKSKSRDKKESSSKNKTYNNSNANDDHFMDHDEIVELSESDEETIALECKRIFEEYVPLEQNHCSKIIFDDEEKDESSEEYISSKKRISRTDNKQIKVIPRAPIKPDFKVNAAQTMAQRITKLKEFHASKQTLPLPEVKTDSLKSAFTPPSAINKIRIAHVPYVSNMMNAKKVIPTVTKSDPSTSSTTIVHTVKKGSQRVAHIPSDKFIDRPGVLEPLASKIPANIRSTYLNLMIDECLKIYVLPTDAYNRAQHEELATNKKCSTVQIYKNSAVLAVSRLRKETTECNGIRKSATECPTLQSVMDLKSGNGPPSWSIVNKNKKNTDLVKNFVGAKFYNNISKWILNEEQLQENGFPRPHPSGEKGKAKIYAENTRQRPPKGVIRVCCRCKKDYIVTKKGFPVVKEECVYHPNNKYRVRGEVRYQCCSQDGSSEGCCIAPVHVYDFVDYENLKGYVKTLAPETILEDYGVYALDCEMCYTTHGLDLTRVTVINASCKVVYETLIKPLHPIIDYNTRYSGITEEHMADVKTTLLEVQATLLSMFTNRTILIGHSLESDFKALKLIHDTVIDTSVVFPHKMGPPYKRALRNLSSEYLRKIIQNSVDGHDSAEDATVCMELMIHKLREDLKTR